MGKSVLLTEELLGQMKNLFDKMNQEVKIVAILEEGNCKSVELNDFLEDIAKTSDLLKLEKRNKEDVSAHKEVFDLEHLPSVHLFVNNDSYTGISFHGIPSGKELNSFVAAVLNCGGAGQAPDKFLKKSIDSIKKQKDIKIFVSLACHHCPHVVSACHKIAYLNQNVQAHMYDANIYPDLVEQYKIERVPMIVINESNVYYGKKSIEEIANLLNMTKN